MSDERANNIEIIGGEVRKNLSAVLKVSVGDFNGRTYIYFETWMKSEGEEGEGTLRGGTSLKPSTLAAVLPLLTKALEVANARGGRGATRRAEPPALDAEAQMMAAFVDVEPRGRRGRR